MRNFVSLYPPSEDLRIDSGQSTYLGEGFAAAFNGETQCITEDDWKQVVNGDGVIQLLQLV
ncbi:hypothetical protein DI458_40935 [Burkholderia contaminans]|uniref:Uncharacterized protein n=1 Tax=Burkholderia contaminans LMG 23361 TaxID=1334628 RepID=A0ABD4B0B5_9BURK|nr:hypothetical protein WR31_04540 [Burkholderia contaminans LMG 23361]MBA9934696.1 hypothetical protein [Burkholderia contaminans]ODN29301.1 hypothetical protein BGI28_31610 [Burkholderia contaminans]RBQ56672.1 hypothetical protein DI458_40935 [Burkholderia contaminans]RDT04117.1 hypothetical protein DWU95_07785 [Burkholderia contaminans]